MNKLLLKFLGTSKPVNFKTEILSGTTVAFALVPEAIAFALLAGFHPLQVYMQHSLWASSLPCSVADQP